MRLQGTTEFNIQTDTFEGSLKSVRAQLEKINFNKGITILAFQPEVGKTEAFLRYCEANTEKNIFYFSPNHPLLYEVEDKLRKRLPSSNIIHWEGKDNKCNLIMNGDPYVTILKNYQLPISSFCEFCEHKPNCEYIDQFNYSKPAIILAPSNYIGTHYINNYVDVIFVDEILKECNEFSWTLEEEDVIKAIELLKNKKEIHDKSILNVLEEVPKNREKLMNIDIVGLREIFQHGIDLSITKLQDFTLLSKVLSSINSSKQFMEWKDLYKDSKTCTSTYYEPHIYNLFRLAESMPIVFLDASFNREIFTDLLKGYDGECGINNNFETNIFYSEVVNKESVLIRVKPTAWYPKASISSTLIKKVKYVYDLNKKLGLTTGIITLKLIEKRFSKQYDTLHYGLLRGQNKFENKDVLIILGTYQPHPNAIIDLHKKLYLTTLDQFYLDLLDLRNIYEEKTYHYDKEYQDFLDYEEYRKTLDENDPDRYDNPHGEPYPRPKWGYPDKRHVLSDRFDIVTSKDGKECFIKVKARLMESILREDEMYQAIHRIRPLGRPKKVYVLGIIPEIIKDELSYEEIPDINYLIEDLESQVQKKERKEFDIETFFEEGKRITEIIEQIKSLGYGKTGAYNKVNKLIDNSQWEKVKTKIEGIDKPVYILMKS